jgi:hypothetical protein
MYLLFLSDFQQTWTFSAYIRKNAHVSYFIKIRPLEHKLFHRTDGKIDRHMAKWKVPFPNFTLGPRKYNCVKREGSEMANCRISADLSYFDWESVYWMISNHLLLFQVNWCSRWPIFSIYVIYCSPVNNTPTANMSTDRRRL